MRVSLTCACSKVALAEVSREERPLSTRAVSLVADGKVPAASRAVAESILGLKWNRPAAISRCLLNVRAEQGRESSRDLLLSGEAD